MSETSYVFGIDLGTTYSCISYLKDGRPVVCQSLEGENTTPSVVRLLPDEPEPVVGRTAKDMAVIYPDNTIQFVKGKIGQEESFEYGPEGDRRTTTPVIVSAEILKKLARDASAYTNSTVKDVVITVPAYFGQGERTATKEAGELAGLNVVDIVEEPTASAFYYGCNNADSNDVICVFDLGGGTFDVTAMKIDNGNLRVLTTEGNHALGGRHWDEELINLVINKFRESTGYDEEFDVDLMQELTIKCENAKKQLTSTNSASVGVNVDRQHKGQITITREEFDDATSTLLSTAIDLTKKVFETVKNEHNAEISKILLVGGSSKMPQVREAIVANFGMEPIINEPDESVSKGACLYNAWKLVNGDETVTGEGETITKETDKDGNTTITIGGNSGEPSRTITIGGGVADMNVTTVATKSFGIVTFNQNVEVISNLLKKDTPLPHSFSGTFGIHDAGQTSILLQLYQSDLKDDEYDPQYGMLVIKGELTGLPEGLPAGHPVEISINMSESGFISLSGSCNGAALIGTVEVDYNAGAGN